jgi:hypothetical protein
MDGQHTWLHWRRFVIPVVATMMVVFSLTGARYAQAAQHPISAPAHTAHQSMPASTYNCTTNPNPPNNGLCYAVVQWTCCGQFFGVATSPYVKWVGCNPKYCTTGNDWHTNRTEWLAEVDDWSYANCPLHECWIEAGWVEGCSSWDANF